MYRTLEVIGPEHEFSVNTHGLAHLSIVDKIIKDKRGRLANSVNLGKFAISKELQKHVLEFKATRPFYTPEEFDEVMYAGLEQLLEHLNKKYDAFLLGTGIHPLATLDRIEIWDHYNNRIYQAFGKLFDMKQHGWLNIQSFHLNLPYTNEKDCFAQYNAIANFLPYLPALAASSPVYEGKFAEYVDQRMFFYPLNQKEVPAISGKIIPEYAENFAEWRRNTIDAYSEELRRLGGPEFLMAEWLNSRGLIIRQDRRALEIRVMDEQECIKSDVALASFVRALIRKMLQDGNEGYTRAPFETLVEDYNNVIKYGLEAKVKAPQFYQDGSNEIRSAREVLKKLVEMANEYATIEEKKYLDIIRKRIEKGNLSNVIRKKIEEMSKSKDFREAIIEVYEKLSFHLERNEPLYE